MVALNDVVLAFLFSIADLVEDEVDQQYLE
jgi:hypothetical protein